MAEHAERLWIYKDGYHCPQIASRRPDPKFRASTEYVRVDLFNDERERHEQLQARCFDGGGRTVFDEVKALRLELAELRKDKARLDSGCMLSFDRDEFGEVKHVLHIGMDLRQAIDAGVAAQKERAQC